MKFKVWESKLCERMNIWYKAAEKDGQELVRIVDIPKISLSCRSKFMLMATPER